MCLLTTSHSSFPNSRMYIFIGYLNRHAQHASSCKTRVHSSHQLYPDEGHFLSHQSNQHLYATLTSFYRECLKEELLPLTDDEDEEEE